jgi:hypothetical protein
MMRRATGWPIILAMLGALGLAGCSSEPTRPAGPPTDYRGVIVGSEGSGTIEVLVAHPPADGHGGTVPVRATLRLYSGFQVHHLEGSFDLSTGSLTLSGSGWSFHGTNTSGLLSGDGSTASGSSVFIAQRHDPGASPVLAYTGPVQHQAGLAIRAGLVVGAAQVSASPLRVVTLFGSFSTADSSLTLLDTANPSAPPVGRGRLITDPYTTWASVRFGFGSGNVNDWTGYPTIGYSGP